MSDEWHAVLSLMCSGRSFRGSCSNNKRDTWNQYIRQTHHESLMENLLFYCSITTASYHAHIQSFKTCPSYVPSIIMSYMGLFCCFYNKYIYINFKDEVARRVSEPHMSASFRVCYCSVCELCELNPWKKEKNNFGCLWESRHFLFNPFPMHVFA